MDKTFNVLFLCTGNSARSIMAEAILAKDSAGRFRAFSAGSQPKGAVHPTALWALDYCGYATEGLASKSWQAFSEPDAPQMDFVITVCDNAAGETCPLWPGQPLTAHWGIEDPAAAVGTQAQIDKAFLTALRYLKRRIGIFTSLPIATLSKIALTARLREIGQLDGATSRDPKVA